MSTKGRVHLEGECMYPTGRCSMCLTPERKCTLVGCYSEQRANSLCGRHYKQKRRGAWKQCLRCKDARPTGGSGRGLCRPCYVQVQRMGLLGTYPLLSQQFDWGYFVEEAEFLSAWSWEQAARDFSTTGDRLRNGLVRLERFDVVDKFDRQEV